MKQKCLDAARNSQEGKVKYFYLIKSVALVFLTWASLTKKLIKPSWVRVDVDILGFALREHYAYIKPYYCTICTCNIPTSHPVRDIKKKHTK